jgi:hypothetical protein
VDGLALLYWKRQASRYAVLDRDPAGIALRDLKRSMSAARKPSENKATKKQAAVRFHRTRRSSYIWPDDTGNKLRSSIMLGFVSFKTPRSG